MKAAGRLPSPVGVAIRVLDLCRSGDSEICEIADAVMSDPALSARLLTYANSAAVGAGREVTSVREAVLIMGLRAVKLTALGFSLAVPESRPRCPSFDFKRFWTGSFLTAAVARRLAAPRFDVWREEAFTAGLLARMGQLALAHGLPEQYNGILMAARGRPLPEVEREHLGLDHAQFGAQLLSDWGLPEVLARAAEFQLEPSGAPEWAEPLARTIHLAHGLLPLFAAPGDAQPPAEKLTAARELVENSLELDDNAWQRAADQILGDYEQVADIFEMPGDGEISVLSLYADAQEEATRVGIVAQLEQNRTLEVNRELHHRATTDALTGIANRAKFEDKLKDALRGLQRGHGHFVVILFDIDHFKRFNDTYGHETGDLVLKDVARTAQVSLRDVDLAARYGGDEFVILAPRTDRAGACIIAERLRRRVHDLCIEVNGQVLSVTVSLGLVATADYEEALTTERIMSDADKQLYVAKERGRNTWCYLGRSLPRDADGGGRSAGAA